jgi:hypothetical protein
MIYVLPLHKQRSHPVFTANETAPEAEQSTEELPTIEGGTKL